MLIVFASILYYCKVFSSQMMQIWVKHFSEQWGALENFQTLLVKRKFSLWMFIISKIFVPLSPQINSFFPFALWFKSFSIMNEHTDFSINQSQLWFSNCHFWIIKSIGVSTLIKNKSFNPYTVELWLFLDWLKNILIFISFSTVLLYKFLKLSRIKILCVQKKLQFSFTFILADDKESVLKKKTYLIEQVKNLLHLFCTNTKKIKLT